MKNAIATGLLCLSLASALTSCHDSVETLPSAYTSIGKIFYSQVDYANYQGKACPVVTSDLAGTNQHVIAQGLSLSAAGGKILYLTAHGEFQDDIYISNDDGSSPKKLFTFDTATGQELTWMPALSPDGSKVIYGFTSKVENMIDVKVQDVATGVMTYIDRVQNSETRPGFSADSKNVIYFDDKKGSQSPGNLKIANLDGTGVRILTSVLDAGLDFASHVAPRPGTNQIAYYDNSATYLINTDGTGKRLLVNGVSASWSSDGSKLAYAAGDTSGDLFVTADLGATATQLTNTPSVNEAYPVWSPDGKTVYALSWSGNYDHTTQSLILVDVATKQSKVLASPAQYLFVTK